MALRSRYPTIYSSYPGSRYAGSSCGGVPAGYGGIRKYSFLSTMIDDRWDRALFKPVFASEIFSPDHQTKSCRVAGPCPVK